MKSGVRKRYAIVGCGGRGIYMFALPIVEKFSKVAELVGVCDVNPKRMDFLKEQIKQDVPAFTDFSSMLDKTHPDTVIVTTIDSLHHKFIIEALEAGCDAITEKPMTIDDEKCRAILKTEERTGKKVTVTFNYRFTPYVMRLKELLAQGILGEIFSVDFYWFLDTKHGADYFRRWHRQKKNSGGLLVHKATHHFDMVNFFIEQEPETVFAFGNRMVYGPTRKERGERCLTCRYKKTCEFHWDIKSDPVNREPYLRAEKEDGYYRDRCVFADEIDIEDTMALCVRYSKRTLLSYSLIAHAPYEGWRMSLNGERGRIEAEEFHSGPKVIEPIQKILFHNRRGGIEEYIIPKAIGGHGGGDEHLLNMLFANDTRYPRSYLGDSRAGAMSILTGIAANYSIKSGMPIGVKELLKRSPSS